ncbi:DUF1214 domain-containing protein [Nocardia sp. NPDC052566]|uniref:DUF1214 domain-containing protein n=1 Tax=Nocardia sp. NPDC052566 TaxID=3364330 RepID=UPI0037CB211C
MSQRSAIEHRKPVPDLCIRDVDAVRPAHRRAPNIWAPHTRRSRRAPRPVRPDVTASLEDAIYLVDRDGEPLTGAGSFTITIDPSRLPCAPEGFWTLTVFGTQGRAFAAGFELGNRERELARDTDGLITVGLSSGRPAAPWVNWLPVPDGAFSVLYRAFLPVPEVIRGTYGYPPIVRAM